MAVTDIASRTYNHGWRLDPIVRSLLDTDFYKLLMLQMIREFYPDQRVTFSVINRTRHVRLGRDHRRGRTARPARPCPHHPLFQEGTDLARRQYVLRQDPDVLAGLHPLARQLPPARIRTAQGRRPVRAALPRPVDPHHDVGNPGARDHERVALAPGDQGTGTLRARRALCARQGQAVVQGRATAQARRLAPVGLRHPPPPRPSVAALVRRGGQGGPRAFVHRHLQRAAGDGQRSRSDRHQRA